MLTSPFRFLPLLDPLVESVMKVEANRHHHLIMQLINENHALGGHKNGFFFLGMRYSNLETRHVVSENLRYIVPSLTEAAHTLHSEILQAFADEKKLRQSLSVVLPRCKSNQDVRDVLPEVFIREVSQLKDLKRTRPEGFLLEDHPMLHNQYVKAVNIAKYYTANKILY